MSILYKNLRIHQIFGANTDVGKTVLSSALVRASAARKNTVFYLKPVSTGPAQDADDEYVIFLDLHVWILILNHVGILFVSLGQISTSSVPTAYSAMGNQ